MNTDNKYSKIKSAKSLNPRQSAIQTMNKYPKYKPSGVEWIGEIPEHWSVLNFKYITDLMTCGHAATPNYVNEADGVMFLSAQNIQNEKIDLAKFNYITKELHEQLTRNHKVEKGDLLQVRVGGESTVGQTAIIDFNFNGSIYVSLSHIKLNEKAHNRYVKFLCNSTRYKEYSSVIMKKGAGVANFNVSDQRLIKIPLPSLSEQTTIANYLDDKTAKIDTLIEKKKKLIELLKEERTAVINHYVLGQHLLIDNGQLTIDNSQFLIMNYQLPKHWEVKKLKYVLSIKSGDGIKSEEIDFEGTYPVYGGNGVMGYTEKYNSDKLDIIIGRVGAKCGNVRLVDGKKWISDNALVSELFEGYDYKFISIVLKSINLNSLANQNAQPLITGTLVRDKIVSLPLEMPEQLQIVHHIETETKRIDETISKIEKEIELLAEYRTALISEVVTGKIRVTDT